jgi:hypothetical protein
MLTEMAAYRYTIVHQIKNQKEFTERHVRNFKKCIGDASHDRRSRITITTTLAKMEDGEMGSSSRQADLLPGNRLVTRYRLFGGKR